MIPGLKPTKTQMRLGSSTSVRGARCAYIEGGAYCVDVRCRFAGELDTERAVSGLSSFVGSGRLRLAFVTVSMLTLSDATVLRLLLVCLNRSRVLLNASLIGSFASPSMMAPSWSSEIDEVEHVLALSGIRSTSDIIQSEVWWRFKESSVIEEEGGCC